MVTSGEVRRRAGDKALRGGNEAHNNHNFCALLSPPPRGRNLLSLHSFSWRGGGSSSPPYAATRRQRILPHDPLQTLVGAILGKANARYKTATTLFTSAFATRAWNKKNEVVCRWLVEDWCFHVESLVDREWRVFCPKTSSFSIQSKHLLPTTFLRLILTKQEIFVTRPIS